MLTVGAQSAYYIVNFQVYELNLEKYEKPKQLKNLKDKNIRKIVNGAKHFFAI